MNNKTETQPEDLDKGASDAEAQANSGTESPGGGKTFTPAKEQKPKLDNGTEETIRALESELEVTKQKAQENWDLALRCKAEADNARRRATLDVEKAHKFGFEKITADFLLVLDSIERGLESISATDAHFKAIHEGMTLTHKLMIDTLLKHGIKQVNPVGEDFDPKLHEALSMQESNEVEPNKVLTVIQTGFTLHERVLRPARVIVARAAQAPTIDEKA